jgi:hypothetical protein
MLEHSTTTTRLDWNAERSALVADTLRSSGGLRSRVHLRVHGESMLPALWPGEVVEIASCSLEDIQPGDIVLVRRDDRLFLHRFVAHCTPDGFVLRGDSVPRSDPQFPGEALLGRLVRRTEGRRILGPGLDAKWSRAVGMLFCYCAVARRLALKIHSPRKAPQREFRNLEPLVDFRSSDIGAL